jgi:hypothetical protein
LYLTSSMAIFGSESWSRSSRTAARADEAGQFRPAAARTGQLRETRERQRRRCDRARRQLRRQFNISPINNST